MNTNETPETDRNTGLGYCACKLIETSRRLERERNKLIAALRQIKDESTSAWAVTIAESTLEETATKP